MDAYRLRGHKSREVQALTLSPRGLTPEVLRRIIFEDQLQLTTLHKPLSTWQGARYG